MISLIEKGSVSSQVDRETHKGYGASLSMVGLCLCVALALALAVVFELETCCILRQLE